MGLKWQWGCAVGWFGPLGGFCAFEGFGPLGCIKVIGVDRGILGKIVGVVVIGSVVRLEVSRIGVV